MRYYFLCVLLPIVGTSASAYAQVSGTLESYFSNDRTTHGSVHQTSWGEINARIQGHYKATVSYFRYPGGDGLDESYLEYDSGFNIFQVGRIRTAFGLGDWSDLFYTGFNHVPLILMNGLSGELGIGRDDAGVQATFGSPGLQIQASAIDDQADSYQITPKQIRASTLRLQTSKLGAILGLDLQDEYQSGVGIAGLDLRWTTPHLIARGEYMTGYGSTQVSSGYYVDLTFRPGGQSRTQLLGRTERYTGADGTHFDLQTVGGKAVITDNISVNVNYGWGDGNPNIVLYSPGVLGWSARTMFQITF